MLVSLVLGGPSVRATARLISGPICRQATSKADRRLSNGRAVSGGPKAHAMLEAHALPAIMLSARGHNANRQKICAKSGGQHLLPFALEGQLYLLLRIVNFQAAFVAFALVCHSCLHLPRPMTLLATEPLALPDKPTPSNRLIAVLRAVPKGLLVNGISWPGRSTRPFPVRSGRRTSRATCQMSGGGPNCTPLLASGRASLRCELAVSQSRFRRTGVAASGLPRSVVAHAGE